MTHGGDGRRCHPFPVTGAGAFHAGGGKAPLPSGDGQHTLHPPGQSEPALATGAGIERSGR